MSRYKGQSKKGAIDANDLRELADCYRRVSRIHASLNPVCDQILPLMAVAATLKACWAELSGAGGFARGQHPDGRPFAPSRSIGQTARAGAYVSLWPRPAGFTNN